MILIAIIIALALERFFGNMEELRRVDLLLRLGEWLQNQSTKFNSWIGAILILTVIGLGVEYVHRSLLEWNSFSGLLLSAAVLAFCLGPKNFQEQIKSLCESVEANNMESAYWQLEQIKYHPLRIDEQTSIIATALQTLFVAVNNRILGVIFWFVALGPLGAVIYRMASVYHFQQTGEDRSPFLQTFDRIYFLINWPCARLVALSYAVVGSFSDAVKHLKDSVTVTENWPDSNENLLVCSGLGAMHLDQNNKDLNCEDVTNGLALVRRSVAFWVGVAALMTLAGWLG